MLLLAFLFGVLAPVATTETTTNDRGIEISAYHKLISLIGPTVDLDLSGLGLRSIDPNAFVNCAATKTLDLSNNSIQELPERVFSPLTNLEHLSLANNDLRGVATKNSFLGLNQLKSLNISNNPLKKILDKKNFAGLTKSCDIIISGSKKFQVLSPLVFGKDSSNSDLSQSDNRTTANQEKRCTERFSTNIERSLSRSEPGINSSVRAKVCMERNNVNFVESLNVNETLPAICKEVKLDLHAPKLQIVDLRITSFDKGWYRLQQLPFTFIYFDYNKLAEVTSDLLNDLPQSIKYVSLGRNQIERLNKGVIVNEHLRALDLSKNYISVIEEDAFIGTNLTHLNLEGNELKDLRFVLTLPRLLVVLNLESNEIEELPAGGLSHLNKLLDLNLCFNKITNLHPQSLSGLESLQFLEMCFNDLQTLRPGVFQDLANLRELDIYGNKISGLDKGVFNGLGCLSVLDLNSNNLTRFDKEMLQGLTDNLDKIYLNFNKLESLEAGSFVNIPRSDLAIKYNNIRQIEKDAFDLPYLKYLDLQGNKITRIAKGAAKNLGKLAMEIQIRLTSNPITILENGALAGLPSRASVYLSETPIEVIQAGVFDDV